MLYGETLLRVLISANAIFALIILKDEITTDDIASENILINENISWSVWNTESQINNLEVDHNGSFYISAPENFPSLKIRLINNFINKGVVSFNSSISSKEQLSIFEANLLNLDNQGEIFFVNSNGDNKPSSELKFQKLSNKGSLTFYKQSKPNGVVNLFGEVENGGDICLYNQDFSMTNEIKQSCIHIQGSSKVTIPTDAQAQIYDQIYYMEGAEAELVVKFGTFYLLNVAGFGDGNQISARTKINSFKYINGQGTLLLSGKIGTDSCMISIGSGYELSSFVLQSGSLYYMKAVPNRDIPIRCKKCPLIPKAPEAASVIVQADVSSYVSAEDIHSSEISLSSSIKSSMTSSTNDFVDFSSEISLSSSIKSSMTSSTDDFVNFSSEISLSNSIRSSMISSTNDFVDYSSERSLSSSIKSSMISSTSDLNILQQPNQDTGLIPALPSTIGALESVPTFSGTITIDIGPIIHSYSSPTITSDVSDKPKSATSTLLLKNETVLSDSTGNYSTNIGFLSQNFENSSTSESIAPNKSPDSILSISSESRTISSSNDDFDGNFIGRSTSFKGVTFSESGNNTRVPGSKSSAEHTEAEFHLYSESVLITLSTLIVASTFSQSSKDNASGATVIQSKLSTTMSSVVISSTADKKNSIDELPFFTSTTYVQYSESENNDQSIDVTFGKKSLTTSSIAGTTGTLYIQSSQTPGERLITSGSNTIFISLLNSETKLVRNSSHVSMTSTTESVKKFCSKYWNSSMRNTNSPHITSTKLVDLATSDSSTGINQTGGPTGTEKVLSADSNKVNFHFNPNKTNITLEIMSLAAYTTENFGPNLHLSEDGTNIPHYIDGILGSFEGKAEKFEFDESTVGRSDTTCTMVSGLPDKSTSQEMSLSRDDITHNARVTVIRSNTRIFGSQKISTTIVTSTERETQFFKSQNTYQDQGEAANTTRILIPISTNGSSTVAIYFTSIIAVVVLSLIQFF